MKKLKTWELLEEAVRHSDHTGDCAISQVENETRKVTKCTCWLGKAAARVEMKSAADQGGPPMSTDEPRATQADGVIRLKITRLLRGLHALMPEDIRWPDAIILKGKYRLSSDLRGRPEALGIPKVDNDKTAYREVSFHRADIGGSGEHYTLFTSFQYPKAGPAAHWGEGHPSKPDDLSWAQVWRLLVDWIPQMRAEVESWMIKSRRWPDVVLRLHQLEDEQRGTKRSAKRVE